jgi:hypothetical protein
MKVRGVVKSVVLLGPPRSSLLEKEADKGNCDHQDDRMAIATMR